MRNKTMRTGKRESGMDAQGAFPWVSIPASVLLHGDQDTATETPRTIGEVQGGCPAF